MSELLRVYVLLTSCLTGGETFVFIKTNDYRAAFSKFLLISRLSKRVRLFTFVTFTDKLNPIIIHGGLNIYISSFENQRIRLKKPNKPSINYTNALDLF